MLATDAKRLRWLGIDMRPRWRRRTTVVLTYVVFLVVVWMHPRGSYELIAFMAYGGVFIPLVAAALKESLGPVSRWIVVLTVGFAVAAWLLWTHPLSAPHQNAIRADVWALLWIVCVSSLAYPKLVEPVWMRSSVKRWLRRPRRLHTLDEFARHFYGESFANLTEEQQIEVGRRERENPMGEWVTGGNGRFLLVDDERVRHEDDRIRAQAQRLMTWVLFGSAVMWSFVHLLWKCSLNGDVLVAWAWTLAALGLTLRQAIVLWVEADVTVTSGEMELVGREA